MAQPANAAFVAAQPALVVAEARKREAQEYFKREQWEAAVAAFGEALATVAGAGDSEKAAQLRLAIALNLALAALRSGDAAKAASACEDALALDGGNLKALYRRGVARGQLEDWAGAAADLEAVAARAGEGGVAAAARQALAALRDQQAAAQRGERDADPARQNAPLSSILRSGCSSRALGNIWVCPSTFPWRTWVALPNEAGRRSHAAAGGRALPRCPCAVRGSQRHCPRLLRQRRMHQR